MGYDSFWGQYASKKISPHRSVDTPQCSYFSKHDYEKKTALPHNREPIFKITLQESDFGSFFLSVCAFAEALIRSFWLVRIALYIDYEVIRIGEGL